MAYKKGLLGIDLKRDADALAVGFLAAILVAVLPIPGDPFGGIIAKIREMFKR